MVRTDDQSTNLQNFDNRLLQQEDYVDYNDRPYLQKVSSSDEPLIQFVTDYDLVDIKAEVFDIEDNLIADKTSGITLILASTSFDIYDLKFQVAVEGNYYLKITFDTETYESEWFQIDGYETDNVLKFEYNTSENDGIAYLDNETFIIRCEGRMVEFKPGMEKEVYTNYNESLVNLNAYPVRVFKVELGAIPRYMIEKINLALSHQLFKINDVEYQSKDEVDAELIQDKETVTNLYEGSFNAQQVDYEDYTTASDDVEPTIYPITVDEVDTVLFIVDAGVTFYTKYKD
jgi:hypothetical protein